MGPVLTGLRTNWQKLDDSSWGVKLQGGLGEATGHSGRVVSVTNRAGKEKHVELGAQVDQWNGGRSAVYKVAGRSGETRQRAAQRVQTARPMRSSELVFTDHELRTIKAALSVDIGETDGTPTHYELYERIDAYLAKQVSA